MIEWWQVALGLGLQTVVLLVGLFKMHGQAMRMFGKIETKIDAMWEDFLMRKQ